MQILHKSKRAVPPPTPVIELINKLLNTPDADVAQTISEIDVWRWARSDLNAWIKVLNKFDAILEDIIREYEIDKLQTTQFKPASRKTLIEVLRFERLLLENSTNRKMYNSYDRINSLLFTSDLGVLIATLKLLLRPSQQYSAQPAVSQALNISTPRLQSLAKRWPHLREHNIDLLQLCSQNYRSEVENLPAVVREVNFSFYRTGVTARDSEHQPMETDVTASPQQSPHKVLATTPVPNTGAVVIHISEETLASKPPMELLADLVEQYSVPDSEKFELLCRIRSAHVLQKGNHRDCESLVMIRLYAIAIFGHTHSESQAGSSLFMYEPDLVSHIAELLHVDKGVPLEVQTVAISSLDALARYRNRIQEVLMSVNAGVNHGILMSILRKALAHIATVDSVIPHSFVEALLSFITFIASHSAGGNMMVGAGLIPLLVQVLDNKIPTQLPVISKAMQLIDNILYSYTTAFGLFCAARGIEALVDRIAYEIDLDIKEHGDMMKSREIYGSHGEIPVARATVLKHILRSLHRMMHSAGTSEGLRGLIDTSILRSIRRIIEFRGLFGPSVLPIAINIMSTFVHNEPSSLSVVQEAGLPEAFYKSIEIGLEPAIEVIQAITNAVGALCLNEIGQEQLARRPSIIPAIFSIFTSDRHLKVLLDKENAVLIGTAIDELIRHHPTLKGPVFDSIISTLSKVEDLGNAYEPPKAIKQWYSLLPVVDGNSEEEPSEDVEMDEVEPRVLGGTPEVQLATDLAEDGSGHSSSKHDNNIVSFMDIIGRFLEGLFQHPPHCRDFMTSTDALKRLGRITALPCLPYDFANSVASDSMVQVIRTMTEVAPAETLAHLCETVSESLELTRAVWDSTDENSKLLPLVNISVEQVPNANETFRSLVTLHNRMTILSDVFATAGYGHGRAAITILQTLMSNSTPEVIMNLGALHRTTIWENIALKKAFADIGIDIAHTPLPSPIDGTPEQPLAPLPEVVDNTTASSTAPNGVEESNSPSTTPLPPTDTEKTLGPLEHNAAALKHLSHGLPNALMPFFTAMVRMFHSRRPPEATQRKQMTTTSTIIAEIALQHLTMRTFEDKTAAYTYHTIMLGLMTSLMVDERTTSNPLHTVQVLAFYRAGSLDAVIEVARQFVTSIDTVMAIKEDARTETQSQELLLATGVLRVAVNLFHLLISSKSLFESGQTNIIATRDKPDTDPDYFEAHNFLVRLRLTILPFLKEVWKAPWLIQVPLSLSRSIVQTVLEISTGDNEEGRALNTTVPSALGLTRTPGTDENRIRQLTDMGFPRSAAERALAQTHNNVSAATELLLAHPFPFPPDPEPEVGTGTDTEELQVAPTEQTGDPAPEASATSSTDPAGEVPLPSDASAKDDAPAKDEKSTEEPILETPSIVGKTAAEWRTELNEAREPLKAGIGRQALLLVDKHPSLIFDLHSAFIRPSGPHQEKAVHDLIDDISAFSPFAYDVQEQPLANRCRLLALVICEIPSSLSADLRARLMDNLLALLLSNPVNIGGEHPATPIWLAAHLLVAEALFTLADQPRAITVPKEDEPIITESISTGPALVEARNIVFEFCMRLLAIPDLRSDELLSTLRLFVLLTRDPQVASTFVKRDGVPLMFNRIRSSAVNGSSSYFAIILRHCVEVTGSLDLIMRQSIKRYFAQPRSRNIDVPTYVRSCSSMALREPHVFIAVTQSLCSLASAYAANPTLVLKPEQADEEDPTSKGEGISSGMQVDQPTPIAPGNPEAVVHFLLGELMLTAKAINDPSASEVTSTSPEATTESTATKLKNDCQYACFLMQCLAELVFSYESCKTALLTFSNKKKPQTPAKESGSKFKPFTLNFLLSDLVSFRTLDPQPTTENRERGAVCSWAMSVIVALCVDSSSTHEGKEIAPELVLVRKYVLEAVSRALKEPGVTESVEDRYGRLLAQVDLCHRLLTVRFNTSSRRQQEDTPTHIAKIMLEKGFVATLTTALSDVDLNYPNVKGLVASILRPLEYLSKVAIKMSKSAGKGKDSIEDVETDSDVSSEEEDDARGPGREETPDLYRNSALGIYGGEMDDGTYPADNDDEEMEDIDEESDGGDEMDFGDQTGSEHTSDSDSEADELDDVGGQAETWGTVDDEDDEDDDEDDEDLIHNEDDEDDVDGQDDAADDGDGQGDEADDDEEGDEEMIWHDVHPTGDPGIIPRDDPEEDEEDEGAPVHIIHEEDEDEPEVISDDEYPGDLSIEEHGGEAIAFGGAIRDVGNGIFVHRRHPRGADDGVQVFGRSRHAPAAPPEATTHPLLLDLSNPAGRGSGSQSRSSRHRIVASGNNELLQTIEELVSNGAAQLFQHVMMRTGRGGGTETIRLDVPAGTIMNLDRGMRRQGMVQAIRVERAPRPAPVQSQPRDLEPLLTLQRWAEEVKIIHGDLATERVNRLANHVILALLPAAIEAEKQAKIKEQQAEESRRQEQEAAAANEAGDEANKAPEATQSANGETIVADDVPPATDTVMEDPAGAIPPTHDSDTEMMDGTTSTPAAPDPVIEPVQATDPSVPGPSSDTETPAAPARVTVMIHGAVVDITDTGIDPTFLEALPDDMREEVLSQHIRDQRTSQVQRPADSQISSEFLDALPPDLRAEIIHQEALERARIHGETTRGAGATRGPTEIDPASFIASLDPTLRQAVLLDQDDGFIQSLPSDMIAEAGMYRDGIQHRHITRLGAAGRRPRAAGVANSARKLTAHHDSIQLLDKSGVAVLIRLLFFPQVLKKTLLFRVLVNLCENSKTRTELFNLLLNILQDGTGDLTAVDKSFSQLSVRNPKTPKSPGKQKVAADYFSVLPAAPNSQSDAVPDLIAQRCLEALTFIVSANQASSMFFLTEHEVPAGLRRSSSRKGKGKEKQPPQSHYPIVLLLRLLDRQSLLRTPTIMESVVGLLSTVTRPLAVLKKKTDEPVPSTSSAAAGPPTTEVATAVTPDAQVTDTPADAVPATVAPASSSTIPAGVEDPPSSSSAAPATTAPADPAEQNLEQNILLTNPPQIPSTALRLIVNILTVGECSARTFQQSLALIQNLSYLPDGRDIVAQELKGKAQEFGVNLSTDLDDLSAALKGTQEVLVGSLAATFSSSSSIQAKLLRVLKTIDYMYSPKQTITPESGNEEDTEKVQSIYESFRFAPLWKRLGDCLSIIGEKPDTENVATVLLPLIEALMVVCKYVGPKASSSVARAIRVTSSPKSPTTPAEAMEDLFVSFTDAHRKILNLMVRNNPSLMSGSFSLLVHNPRVLDFDNKRNYFTQQLHRRPSRDQPHGTLGINVRRARVFEDSFQQLQSRTGDQIKYGKLSVRFLDEEGVDAGGVSREWFQILARQMFDPNNALFQPCAADKLTYQPNKNSWVNPEHLSFFKFVGRVIGKAIYDGRLLDAYFARSLYRQLLGKPVDYKDVEWVDPEYYNSLCWILENDPTLLELTFSVEADEFGVNRIINLKEGGDVLPVTNDNKREFVQLSAQYRLYSSIKDQIEALSSGFYEIIPKDLVTIFNEQELELLISGTPDIDVDEWRAATEYNGYTSSDPNIVWWWRALKSFTRDEKAKVLSFATGTSRVPLGGFVDLQGVQGVQRFSIHRAYGASDRLPQAHTCFNQIDLPQYSSYEMLRQQVLLAINEGGEGFGFV